MKCKDCAYCKLGWFPSMPDSYVCTGIENPIIVENTERECFKCGDKPNVSKSEGIYGRLIKNLNAVKCDLKEMDDPRLELCIKRIKDVIFDAGRLNLELTKLQAIQEMKQHVDLDVCDCWE